MTRHSLFMILAFRLLIPATGSLFAQTPADALNQPKGTLERIKVHGASLEGNLEKDDPNRDVVVYLPPSYAKEKTRRYPVIYFLHGYTVGAETYVKLLGLQDAMDSAVAGGVREMILVLPDAFTVYSGSMYSNSPTTGDWEGYISHDLISYIDSHYRTLTSRNSRGLAGHSMGGYGTIRIGMKHPEVFAALYTMSSCCLMSNPAQFRGNAAPRERSRGDADANAPARGNAAPGQAAGQKRSGGFSNALFAQAAAWAPNPMNPPRYFDLPTKDGEIQPLIAAKWTANSVLVMVDQYVPNLKKYRAIAMDVGTADPLGADNIRLDKELTQLGVPHSFEQYEGNHTNRIAERFKTKVLPFFSQQLAFSAEPRGRGAVPPGLGRNRPGRGFTRPTATPEQLAKVTIIRDVVYGHKAGMALTYDVIRPKNSKGTAVVNMISGAWFSSWSPPEGRVPGYQELLEKGITVIALHHGSAPQFKVPDAVEDVRCAMRFIKEHAAEYGIDPKRIGAWGASAGGHLALAAATMADDGDPAAADQVLRGDNHIKAVVAYFPPSDMRLFVPFKNSAPALDYDDGLAEGASPIAFVDPSDPPTLIIHGDADRTVPISQGRIMHEALDKAGVENVFTVFPGADHGFIHSDPETSARYSKEARDAMVAWFVKHL